jgi:hypothetical protein
MNLNANSLTSKIPSFVALLTMVFALSACGSSGNSATAPTSPPPVTVSSVAVTAQTSQFVTATAAAKGVQVQYAAVATMSNSTTNTVTATATWASSDTSILAFETAGSPGVATAKKEGSVTVTATETGGTAGTLSYSVSAAEPVSVAISPAQVPDGVPIGKEGTFTATYAMTDNTTADATMDVNWTSSAGTIVIVGNDAGNKGKVVASSAGKSNISVSKGSLSSQNVEVTVFAPLAPPEIAVEPAAPNQLPLGRTQQFRAVLKYSAGQVVDITDSVVWQSSDESIAQFPADWPKGLLLANPTTAGTANITAQDPSSTSQTAPVAVSVSAVAIESVTITPVATASSPLSVDTGRQLGVIATYADKVVRDITQTVAWSTTGTYLSVTDNTGSKGFVKSNLERPAEEAVGTVVITDPISTQSVSVAIDTVGGTLVRIEIAPADKQNLPKGYTQEFNASAIYSDSTTSPVTDQVVWRSSAGDKVAISNTGNTKGEATALSEGLSNISAAVSVEGKEFVSNVVAVEVSAAALQTIAVMPAATVALAVAGTQRLTAIGTFSDTSTRDITGLVNWDSTNTVVVSVISSGSSAGTVRGESAGGPITVVATEPRTGVPGQKLVTVALKAEDTLDVTPAGVTSKPIGVAFTYEAVLEYADGSSLPVSESVQWESSDPAIATVSNEPLTRGKVFGKMIGSALITASDSELTSAPVTFTVLAGVLEAIAITPSDPQAMSVDGTLQFSAQGSYSDGSSQDVTKSVVWNSDSLGIAVITSTAPNEGALTAIGSGLATITASKDGVTSNATSVVVSP